MTICRIAGGPLPPLKLMCVSIMSKKIFWGNIEDDGKNWLLS